MADYSSADYSSADYDSTTTWEDNLEVSNQYSLFAYDFEGTTGPVVDSTLLGNDAINVGCTRGVTGKIGNAFSYNGTSSRVDLTTFTSSQSMTFSAFVNPSAYSFSSAIFATFQSLTGRGIRFDLLSDGRLHFILYNEYEFTTTGTVSLSVMSHVAFKIQGSSISLYINNVKESGTLGAWSNRVYDYSTIGSIETDSGTGAHFAGKIDLAYAWSATLSDTQISDLYNDGNGLEYVDNTFVTFNGTTTKLKRVGIAETFNSETTKLKAFIPETFNGTITKLKRQASPVRFFSETTKLKRADVPQTFNGTTTILKASSAETFNGTTIILRGEGVQSYSFELYDDTDTLEDSATGAPPTTVFPDLFTGVSDGLKTLYIRSVQKYKNLEDTINETMIRFRLVSGIIQPLLPNLPLSVTAETQTGAMVEVSWNYNPTNEETPPTTFEVYADAVSVDAVAYVGATSYKVVLGPFPEVSTVFSVSSLNGVDETVKVVSPAVTPDGTPPTTVPFTFEVK